MIFKALRINPRLRARNVRRDIAVSVSILSACSLIGFMFHFMRLSEANIISIYIIGILLISSLSSSWLYGTVSSICGVLLFNFMYADPTFNFDVYDSQYSITIAVMLVASLAVNYVMTLFRRQLNREKQETRRLDILLEASQQLQQARNAEDIFNVAFTQLHHMFDRAILAFPFAEGEPLKPILKPADRDADILAEDFLLDKGALERFVSPDNCEKSTVVAVNAEKKAVCFKLGSGKELFAVICIMLDADTGVIGFEHNLVLTLLDEVALSLEKHNLNLFNERMAREAEAERLRANLLRGISHDLRTPLTSISGNADILLSDGDRIDPVLRRRLYQDIYNDSEWLINLVENLLFVTRIDNGVMSINTEFEVLQEVIQESLNSMTKRVREHAIRLEMPEDLVVVKIDARLIMQVIMNLVDNARKYAPPGSEITIKVSRRERTVLVEVADTGCGISAEDKKKVFEMFYTSNKSHSDSRRGIGLGLPLCRSILRAHGSSIYMTNNLPNGTIAGFTLNLEEVDGEKQHTGD